MKPLNPVKLWKRGYLYILAFLVPALILAAVYSEFGIFFYGEKSVLITDMNSSYVDFFSSLRDVLTGRSPGGFFYSWSAGPGLGYLGIFTYYLCSPFSLLILFFPKAQITEALLLMILLKIAASGLTFCIFARRKFDLPPVFALIFSWLYALSAYNVVYTTNPMWLDAIILLPLVILGLCRLMDGGGALLYCVCLILTFVTNFYISYMAGIFCLLYFLARCGQKGFSRAAFGRAFLRFALASLVSILAAGIVLLPAFFSIFDSYRQLGDFSLGLTQSQDMATLLSKLFAGSYESLTYGTPNLYTGILTLLLACLFFLNRDISRRRKFFSAALLAVLLFSMIFEEVNLAWHMFRTPTWFPYRYSFLWSFVCLTLACECMRKREGLKWPDILVTAGFWGFVLLLMDQKRYEYLTRGEILENAVFLLTYTIILVIYSKFHQRKGFSALLAGVLLLSTGVELYRNTETEIHGLDAQFQYKTRAFYTDYYKTYSQIAAAIPKENNSFFRTGIDTSRDSNDGMSLNLPGLAHYSSLSNQRTNVLLGSFGYYNGFADRYFFYYGATTAADSVFGVKYVISPDRQDFGLKEIARFGDEVLYENRYALPLGFLASDALLQLDPGERNPFAQLNRFLSLALGEDTEVYRPIPGTTGSHIDEDYSGGYIHTGSDQVEFRVVNDRDQYVYFYADNNFYEGASIYVNGALFSEYPQYHAKGILSLGYFKEGEPIRISIHSYTEDSSFDSALFYGMVEEDFAKAAEKLRTGGLVLDKTPTSVVSGTVKAASDGILFLSIPRDKGWSAKVDGKKAQLLEVSEGFMALRVTAGKHQIRLNYLPRGFVPGILFSLSGICLLVLYEWRRRRRAE